MFQSILFSVKQAVYPTFYTTTIPIFTIKRASFRGYRRTYILQKDRTYILHKGITYITYKEIFRNLELLEMEQVN